MLAHLQDLDFPPLLKHLDVGHIFFLNLFYCDLQTCALVSAKLD